LKKMVYVCGDFLTDRDSLQVKNGVLIIFVFLLWLADSGTVSGQACPRGVRYNCVWGCGRHTDLNGDGYCDYSFLTDDVKVQKDTVPKRDSAAVVSRDSAISVAAGKGGVEISGTPEADGVGTALTTTTPGGERSAPGSQGGSTPRSTEGDMLADPQTGNLVIHPPAAADPGHFPHGPVYNLILISSLTLGLYLVTFLLYKRDVIKRIHHRKVWNLLLLLTFLVSCLFGLFLVVQLNYDVALKIYPTLLVWHVEVGIAMALIAVIHILWHIRYFRNMLKKW